MNRMTRRSFVHTSAVATLAATTIPGHTRSTDTMPIALGFDNFSIRAFGWKAHRLLDYASRQNVDVLMMSDLNVYESFDESYLASVRTKAESLGIMIHAGTGSICPTSQSFNDRHGTAEEHLALTIRVAKAVGSPVARCFLGSMRDRATPGGIQPHVEETIRVCKAVRDQAMDAGVMIAIENHAGDLQAWELAELIEEAGPEYVGATLDSGNATWALESPMTNLEVLGRYAVSSGIRDSAIWPSEDGAMVEWTNMGAGHVDWHAYVKRWRDLCPYTPFTLEIISGIGAREYPYKNADFWENYADSRPGDFSRFIAMAADGTPFVESSMRPSEGEGNPLQRAQQRWDLEESLEYCIHELGLGIKAHS